MTTTIVGKVAYSDNEHDETMDMVHSEYISNQLPFSTIQSNMPNVVSFIIIFLFIITFIRLKQQTVLLY